MRQWITLSLTICLTFLYAGCTEDTSQTPTATGQENTETEESDEDANEETTPEPDAAGGVGTKDTNSSEDSNEPLPSDVAEADTSFPQDIIDPEDVSDAEQDDATPTDTTSGEDGKEENEDDTEQEDADLSDTEEEEDASDGSSDATDTSEPEEYAWEDCDAGDVAWARRAIQTILGRNPAGINEARALAAMVKASDRQTVARGLMELPEYTERWADFLMDELRVNRVGDKAQYNCYPNTPTNGDGGNLAIHIRDNPTSVNYPGGQFDMSDVLGSSLDLDDVSPLYRAHLFAMMNKPITGANVAALEMDLTRRQDFGEIFSAVYTHRGVVCVSCHNSAWGVTDNVDPEKDLHWALPGLFEKAIYGSSAGRPEMEVYSAFRHLGVVGGGARPWDMSDSCGSFTPQEEISNDPAEIEGYLVSAIGQTGSIWNVEEALRNGFDKLREDGLQVDGKTQDVDPEEGFAYLVSTRIVNQVWQEVHGYPLTLVHYIPRNEEQRDTLLELTTEFVESSFSLKTLVASIVSHPLTNQLTPNMGCGNDSPYILPRIWNPWVLDEPEQNMRKNNAGDGIHRKSARTMLKSISYAMNWPEMPDYPNGVQEEFQKAIGVFVKDAEPGFLGVDFQGMLSWESRYGACANPGEQFDWIILLLDAMGNYQAANGSPPSLRQLIAALKDRLLMEPVVEDEEASFLAAFAELESIDVPAFEVPDLQELLRQFCGVFAETPQFLLVGAAEQLDDVSPPEVVVNGLTFSSVCEEIGPVIFPENTVICGPDFVTIE